MSPVRTSFQTRFFFAALSAALLALAVAGLLFATTMRGQTNARIEDALLSETRLAADLIGREALPPAPPGAAFFEDEASRISQLLGARVTLIAPDGRVLGDSSETLEGVAAM